MILCRPPLRLAAFVSLHRQIALKALSERLQRVDSPTSWPSMEDDAKSPPATHSPVPPASPTAAAAAPAPAVPPAPATVTQVAPPPPGPPPPQAGDTADVQVV